MKDSCNHINLKFKQCGTLVLTDAIKEDILTGSAYLSYNYGTGFATTVANAISPTDTRYRLINSNYFTVKRYLMPCAFHLQRIDERYMDWSNTTYSEAGCYYSCGYLFGDFSNISLPLLDTSVEHDNFIADFMACCFLSLMREQTKDAGMYLQAVAMVSKMVEVATDANFISDSTCFNSKKVVPYKL